MLAAWTIPAFIAAACIAVHYLTLRAASGKVSDALGALCVEGTATVGLVVLVLVRRADATPTSASGLAWACASGLCITGAMTALFASLRLGGPVSATGVIVLGGGVALSAFFAPFFFAEAFTLRRLVGVSLGLLALVILATERT